MTAGSSLLESIEHLADLAGEAGLDPAAARDEGLRVAAALAEAVPGAAPGWAAAAGLGTDEPQAVNTAFFDAASRGRRWRAAPTDQLEALAAARHPLAPDYAEALHEVASAAVMLGTAPVWVIANATAASSVYLAAAHGPGSADGGRIAPGGPFADTASPRSGLGGLPALPHGPGTDAVLRSWGLSDSPAPDGGVTGGGGTPSGIPPAAPGAAAAQTAVAETGTEPEEAAEPEKSVEELLAELDAMIGLERVKREIHRQVALLTVEKMRIEAGLKPSRLSRHLIFVGNPGTGKTTVARLIGAIYRALGLLRGGQLVEVDRSELVAGYVGQTAMKTAEVCAKALGGVLFIDEAYSLTGDQYAEEAVGTLVKEMEDHREDLVVIVAGYPDPMVAFIGQNPGLASRFTTTIEFDDYTDDELMAILRSIAADADYELTPEAERRVRMTLEATPRTPAFGNGRFSRNLFEHAVGRHAWRLRDATEPTVDELRLLTAADVVEGADSSAAAEREGDQGDQVTVRVDPDAGSASRAAGSVEDIGPEVAQDVAQDTDRGDGTTGDGTTGDGTTGDGTTGEEPA
ncbi:MAG: AAA family ATPase [Micrococcales bacterium]|nr:AAA family ATPase [Micrococcales bacterium]